MRISFFIVLLFLTTAGYCGSDYLRGSAGNQISKGDKLLSMEIKGKIVQYVSGKDTVSAYLSVPEGEGPFPGLIVIHEWWGLNDWVKQFADDFADSGYAALAIDLYHGKSTSSPEEARTLSGSVTPEGSLTDLQSAFNYLNNLKEVNKNKIGVIGWCMGGGYSLRAALNIPSLSACVINYGRIITDSEMLKQIKCPVLGIFGENDKGISPDNVRAFEKSLNEAGIRNKIIIYPGVGHAFMNPENKNQYVKETTEKARGEIYSFLKSNLKIGK